MPSAPLRPCSAPGCTALVRGGLAARRTRGRCATHACAQKAEHTRHSTDRFGRSVYKSSRWLSFRGTYLARHGFCGESGSVGTTDER